MLRVIVSMKDRILAEHEFDQPQVTIGRAPDNDLRLDNPVLSRHHAAIVRTAIGYEIQDLKSSNGLHVNGEPVVMRRLNDGDVVALGKFSLELRFMSEAGFAPCVSNLEGYVAQGRTLSVKAPAKTEPPPPAALISVSAPRPGTYQVKRDAFRFGSARLCDVRLEGLFMPKQMALIIRGRGGFSLVNVSPRGGRVFRNGRPIEGRCWLRNGDRLEIGAVRARFRTDTGRRQPK